jgi:hypothetical protein
MEKVISKLEKETNMKSRKVLTILLSLAIMVTFMPTFAFAGTAGNANEGHDFTPKADMSNVKVIVEPTCETSGYGVVSCTEEHNGIACTAVQNQVLPALGHEAELDRNGDTRVIEVTADEYYNQMVKQLQTVNGYSETVAKATMDNWMLTYGNDMCVGDVSVCKNCGAFLRARTNTLSDPTSFGRYANREHVAPTGTNAPKACAASFTCEKCGKKDATNATYNAANSDAYHGINSQTGVWTRNAHWVADGNPYHVHSINNDEKYVSVQNYKCDQCGMVKKEATVSSGASLNEFSHPNTETTTVDATCTTNGRTVTTCKDCGYELSRTETPAKGHNWTKATTAATEATYGVEYEYCPDCQTAATTYYKDANGNPTTNWANAKKTNVALPLTHSLKATVVAPKNCTDNSWILVTCENCAARTLIDAANDTGVEKVGDKYYYSYDGARVEIPFEAATGHKYGDAQTIAEADCETPKMEGRVCAECGGIYHTTVREVGKALGHDTTTVTVAATCGESGYSYDTCSRCKKVVLPDNAKNIEYGFVLIDGSWTDVYNVVPPVVSKGTECKFEWKVTKAATDTTDGEKALVCTVCGAVKAGSETVIPADVATAEKKAAVEAATPVIEAAADIIDGSAVYTAKSVEAVKEAKSMLNSAIASGSAADVKAMTENLQNVLGTVEEKDANTMTASGKTVTAKAKSTKTFKKAKAFNVKNAKGKVTFVKKSGNSKITVTSAGKVTVKKGLKKGKTYKVKVTVKAAGNGNFLPASKVVTLKVKVK